MRLASWTVALVLFTDACGQPGVHGAGLSHDQLAPDLGTARRYVLSVEKSGSGNGVVETTDRQLHCGTVCSVAVAAGDSIVLEAVPDSGYSFSGWSGPCAGTAKCVVRMDQDQRVTARFVQNLVFKVIPLGRPSVSLDTIWLGGPGDVWLPNHNGITSEVLRWDGSQFKVFDPIGGGDAIHGSSVNDVWTVGGATGFETGTFGEAAHYVDAKPRGMYMTYGNRYLLDVWSSGPTLAFATNGSLLRWDGSNWSAVSIRGRFSGAVNGLGGTSARDAWAVGGGIAHFDGSSWSTVIDVLPRAVMSVYAVSPTDVWAVGGSGAIVHFDGRDWYDIRGATAADLFDVWGSHPRDVWFVGKQGTILHYDGQDFTTAQRVTSDTLRSVYGSGPNDVWAVGGGGTVLRYQP